MMAHAQKPDFVFPRKGRVHLNRWGRQFSRLLAAEVCPSAWVMLDRLRSEVAWEYWLPIPFASFPFTSPPVRHRVPPGSERALLICNSHPKETIDETVLSKFTALPGMVLYFRAIKSWAERVAWMMERRITYRVLVGKPGRKELTWKI